MLSMPRIRTNLLIATFDNHIRIRASFWKLDTLLANGIEGPQNARLHQVEREFQRNKLDILGLSEIRWWNSTEHISLATPCLDMWRGNTILNNPSLNIYEVHFPLSILTTQNLAESWKRIKERKWLKALLWNQLSRNYHRYQCLQNDESTCLWLQNFRWFCEGR